MSTQFRVQESELAGFSVATETVDRQLSRVNRFVQDHATATDGYSGLMALASGPVDTYAQYVQNRLITISSALESMGRGTNEAAWLYHGTDRSVYERFEVISGHRFPVGAIAYPNHAPCPIGASPQLPVPSSSDPDIRGLLDDVGGSLNAVDDVIAFVTGWSPTSALIEPLSGNWNDLAAAGEALSSAGTGAVVVGDNLDHAARQLDSTWDGAAAIAFNGYAGRVTKALRAEGPLDRLVGEIYQQVATEFQSAAHFMVSTLKSAVDKVVSAAAASWIPLYGEYKIVKTVKEVVDIFFDAKRIIDDLRDTIDTIQTVVDAAQDPVQFAEAAVRAKIKPIVDEISKAEHDAAVVRDLASIDPGAMAGVPTRPYSVGAHPRRDG